MIQQKVRKKVRPLLILVLEKVKLDCPIYSKQTNKMWSLKNLVMLKWVTRASHYAVQYK